MNLDEYEKIPIKVNDLVEYSLFNLSIEEAIEIDIAKVVYVNKDLSNRVFYGLSTRFKNGTFSEHEFVRRSDQVRRAPPEYLI